MTERSLRLLITLHLELDLLMVGVTVLYFSVIAHCDCASPYLA